MSEYQLDKNELTKGLAFPLKGLVGSAIDWINKLDLNKDGHKDVAQIAPVVIKLVPIVAALAPLIDVKALTEWFLAHEFVKDKEGARSLIEKSIETIESHLSK